MDWDNQPIYLEARSVIAKRSVAENSFLAIAGMKSAGGVPSTNTAPFVAAVFQQMGVNAAESKLLVGTHPSYYALLDVLASRIYQNPAVLCEPLRHAGQRGPQGRRDAGHRPDAGPRHL